MKFVLVFLITIMVSLNEPCITNGRGRIMKMRFLTSKNSKCLLGSIFFQPLFEEALKNFRLKKIIE